MNINLQPQVIPLTEVPSVTKTTTPAEAQAKFADTLKGVINNLNQAQIESDRITNKLAAGQVDDLHNVMITAQKASITLETTVQIQQKAIDAYNEIMRMQV